MKYFSLIYQGDVHPATEEKIIPAKEFSTLVEASEILERAREDAEKYQEEVKKNALNLKKMRRKKGFLKGLKS